MANSRGFKIGSFIGESIRTGAIEADGGLSEAAVTASGGGGSSITVYETLDSLPSSGFAEGDRAFVQGNSRFYINNGSGWYNVTLVNAAPFWDSAPQSAYTIEDSATPLSVIGLALDSDNPSSIISYTGFASDSGQYLVNITTDSSITTFTPLSADSVANNATLGNIPDSSGGSFTYTFRATDGISVVTQVSTITYSTSALSAVQYIDYATATAGGNGSHTLTYSTDFTQTVQSGDIIVCAFQGANTSSYSGLTPADNAGNYTHVSGAGWSGDDSWDHNAALFYHVVGAETSVELDPNGSNDELGFHYFLFRGASTVDNGTYYHQNNGNAIGTTNNVSVTTTATAAAPQFVLWSVTNAEDFSGYSVNAYGGTYEDPPGLVSTVYGTGAAVNMQTFLYQSTSSETWQDSGGYSYNNSQPNTDAIIVACRIS